MLTIETVLEQIQDFRTAVEARLDRLEKCQTEIKKYIKSLSRQIDLIHQDIYKSRETYSDLNDRLEQLESIPNAPTAQVR